MLALCNNQDSVYLTYTREVLGKIMSAIGDGDFTALQKQINSNKLSEAEVKVLRDKIDEEIESMLGPLQYLLFDIPGLSYWENKLADAVIGEELESVRKKATEYQFPEDNFENLCEDP